MTREKGPYDNSSVAKNVVAGGATLEDARLRARDFVVEAFWADPFAAGTLNALIRAARSAGPGDTVGPLPDGTVIEVVIDG